MSHRLQSTNLRGALLMLAAMGLYSTHDAFIKVLGHYYSPFQILFFTMLFSFPVATVVILHDTTAANLRPVHPWWVTVRTLAFTGSSFGAFYAFSHLPLAETYAILFVAPLLLTVLAIPLLGERVGVRRWSAVILGLVGVIVVLRPGGDTPIGFGHVAALAGATLSAVSNGIVRKIGRDERPAVLLIYSMLSNFLVMGAFLALDPALYTPPPIEHLGIFVAMAILSTIAALLVIGAYRHAEAAVAAPMQYSQMLWAVGYGFIFFGEGLSANVALGGGIIIASGLYILIRESRAKVSEHTPVLSTLDITRGRGVRSIAGVLGSGLLARLLGGGHGR